MKSYLLYVLILTAPYLAKADHTAGGGAAPNPATQGTVPSSMNAPAGCGGKTSKFSKSQVMDMTTEIVGSAKKASCYLKLFDAETSSNAACEQQKVPNPPGIGLCTLEGKAEQRKARGGKCNVDNSQLGDDEEGVKNQIACCQEIMKSSNGSQYFQPVKEGKVPNCEGGGTQMASR